MTRATRVAQQDAEASTAPRKLKGFFSDKSGVCGLCGCGLGKRYTHEERREHEKGHMHLQNHKAYLEAFFPACEAHEKALQERHTKKRNGDRRELALQLQDEVGTTRWIDHGDATRLKAALWDAMLNPASVEHVGYVLQEHQQAVRSLLVGSAAAVATGGENDAFLVPTLVFA